MTDKYRVMFVGLDKGIEQEVAITRVATKLAIPEAKASTFFANKALFAPADKEKALKQVKLFASMGIQAKLQLLNDANSQTTKNDRDERLFEALDYITSSLIRLEERLDDIEQKLANNKPADPEIEEEDWQDESYLEELDFEPTPVKRSPMMLYSLVTAAVLLIVLLVLTLVYPDLLNF
ncbi:hypothetical protein ACFOEE_01280 [Pseudoalteromonas fenneropenaei]|uniref:Uncharacterized protein n=1 Tax=Pseudoalteromonas fenneropenaei TaxID=1737459 RepID=A0ABV7CEY5_9GAMM